MATCREDMGKGLAVSVGHSVFLPLGSGQGGEDRTHLDVWCVVSDDMGDMLFMSLLAMSRNEDSSFPPT